MKLEKLLKKILSEATEQTILTSSPKMEEMKKFRQTTDSLMKILQKSKVMERRVMFNTNDGANLLTPPTIAKGDITQYMGEYSGENFKDFTQKIAKLYEKSGFKVEEGYGVNEIHGFEIKSQDGNVVGEIDFIERGSVPKLGNTIIVKHKK